MTGMQATAGQGRGCGGLRRSGGSPLGCPAVFGMSRSMTTRPDGPQEMPMLNGRRAHRRRDHQGDPEGIALHAAVVSISVSVSVGEHFLTRARCGR